MNDVIIPVISNDVANSIEDLRADGWSNAEIAALAFGSPPEIRTAYSIYVRDYVKEPGNDTVFLAALVNGYEREKTPEQIAEEDRAARHELLRRVYETKRESGDYAMGLDSGNSSAYADGILFAVQTLGIEIEGVNA